MRPTHHGIPLTPQGVGCRILAQLVVAKRADVGRGLCLYTWSRLIVQQFAARYFNRGYVWDGYSPYKYFSPSLNGQTVRASNKRVFPPSPPSPYVQPLPFIGAGL